MKFSNPFINTKASHLLDQEIYRQWITIGPDQDNYLGKITSQTPTLVTGGKGCGKTHLLRYFSFSIQTLRSTSGPLSALIEDGFMGIYLRLETLSPHRFTKKGQSEDVWRQIFSSYLQLWMAEKLLSNLSELTSDAQNSEIRMSNLDERSLELLGLASDVSGIYPADFHSLLKKLLLDLDQEIERCGVTGKINKNIFLSPPQLVKSILDVFIEFNSILSNSRFLFLMDEFELLNEDQQRCLNTLVRESDQKISYKIGSRLYGLKTFETLNDAEVNKEGSEYERINLEDRGSSAVAYRNFAKKLISKRIASSFEVLNDSINLNNLFSEHTPSLFESNRTHFAVARNEGVERPYFRKLKRNLKIFKIEEAAIEQVLRELVFTCYPLLEKLAILRFYKSWHPGDDILKVASDVRMEVEEILKNPKLKSSAQTQLGHFKSDLIAQIYREFNRSQDYCGVDTIISLSSGLPRSLLVILRHAFEIADFRGECSNNVSKIRISKSTQRDAVVKAASWFFSDAEIKGEDGHLAQKIVENLGRLFRELRFSDKPVDPSLCAFSVDLKQLSLQASRGIKVAEEYSLLLKQVKLHRLRNSKRLVPKYQMSPMLAPLWDLPVSRRGVIEFSAEEAEALFGEQSEELIDQVIKKRLRRMNAPFGLVNNSKSFDNKDISEPTLFDNDIL